VPIILDDLRRFSVARTLFAPTTLKRALDRLQFVQADPIRAPARAQDLILRHRVKNYRAGDLDRNYVKLGLEEDYFIAYGFMTRSLRALMHPRCDSRSPWESINIPWPKERMRRAMEVLEFVRARGEVHPREVDEHFAHGKVRNWFGGSSNVTTQLLDSMQYRGFVRVARREGGIRVYAANETAPALTDPRECESRLDALIDAVVDIQAPLPASSVAFFIRHLRGGVPQWRDQITKAIARTKERLAHAEVDGVEWYWPVNDDPRDAAEQSNVRLLAPFDPIVRDRARFELLWNWTYRFEAYTPAPKRIRGYYAMPLLWRDRVIGWANLSVENAELKTDIGFVKRQPREREFKQELEAELDRMRRFLGLK
jgi:uncharacterized protein YcaQ